MSNGWIDVPQGRVLEEERATIRGLPRASAKALAQARKMWPEAQAQDFEKVSKYVWADKASGRRYRRLGGDPVAGGRS
jgi:hypothetical protein